MNLLIVVRGKCFNVTSNLQRIFQNNITLSKEWLKNLIEFILFTFTVRINEFTLYSGVISWTN